LEVCRKSTLAVFRAVAQLWLVRHHRVTPLYFIFVADESLGNFSSSASRFLSDGFEHEFFCYGFTEAFVQSFRFGHLASGCFEFLAAVDA